MGKFIDFGTVYGRLGNHPGDITTEQASALFKTVSECEPETSICEYDPGTGRSTVIVASAAKNIDCHVYVLGNWLNGFQGAEFFFNRAIKTHRLTSLVSVNPQERLPATISLAIIRPLTAGWEGNGKLKPMAVFMLGEPVDLEGWKRVKEGVGWALYQQ